MHQSTRHSVCRTLSSTRQARHNKRIPRIGKVLFDSQDTSIQCAVRELSENHAVLILNGWMGFPSEFTLYVEPDNIRALCTVKRRRGSTIEVGFLETEEGVRLRTH